MKTHLLFLVALAGIQPSASAQHFEWGTSITGQSVYGAYTVAAPSGGHVFNVGSYYGTANFDPGGTNFLMSAQPVGQFLVKYTDDGDFVWARGFTGGSAQGEVQNMKAAIDEDGNSYVFGSFLGGVDCDPGAGTFEMTVASGYRGHFLTKLNPNGDFLWAQQFANTNLFTPDGGHIIVHGDAIYCTGAFKDQYDFDNGPGVHTLTAPDGTDVFIFKLDTDGEFQWAVNFGATNNTTNDPEYGTGIAADASGNIYVSGSFYNPGDFNHGAGTETLTPQGDADVFIVKLDEDGGFQWAKRMGGSRVEGFANIKAGTNGRIYLTGTVSSNANQSANEDIYVACFSDQGTQLWLHEFGGESMEQGSGLAVDETGSVYVSGDHGSPNVDFDPGTGEALLSSPNWSTNSFILKLDADGNFIWVRSMQDTDPNSMFGLDYKDGALYGSGYFFATLDIDMGTGVHNIVNNTSTGNAYALKVDTTGIVDVSGIDELVEIPFRLYPNPANEKVLLSTDLLTADDMITIFNLAGQPVLSQRMTSLTQEIDVASLSNGTYLVELQRGKAKSNQTLIKR